MDAGLFGHVKKRIESNPSVSFQRKIDWHSESDLPTQEVDLKKCIFSLYSDHDTLKEPKPRARREVPSHYVVGPLPGDTQLSLCVPLSLSPMVRSLGSNTMTSAFLRSNSMTAGPSP